MSIKHRHSSHSEQESSPENRLVIRGCSTRTGSSSPRQQELQCGNPDSGIGQRHVLTGIKCITYCGCMDGEHRSSLCLFKIISECVQVCYTDRDGANRRKTEK